MNKQIDTAPSKIYLLSIFPEIFDSFLKTSLIKKATNKNLLSIEVVNFRDYAEAPHYKVDETPYGGGAGMLLKPEPIVLAVEKIKEEHPEAYTIFLSPAGNQYSQSKAEKLKDNSCLILICGRYEGLDQRAIDMIVDEEISIGDYVLMGGEVPAMVLIESITRLQKEILGNSTSTEEESFSHKSKYSLEAPQYTRPAIFRDKQVPAVLQSGDHAKIKEWRLEKSLEKTKILRPELLKKDR